MWVAVVEWRERRGIVGWRFGVWRAWGRWIGRRGGRIGGWARGLAGRFFGGFVDGKFERLLKLRSGEVSGDTEGD